MCLLRLLRSGQRNWGHRDGGRAAAAGENEKTSAFGGQKSGEARGRRPIFWAPLGTTGDRIGRGEARHRDHQNLDKHSRTVLIKVSAPRPKRILLLPPGQFR